MASANPYALISDAQKVLWRSELRTLMLSDQLLASYASMAQDAMFFSDNLRSESHTGIGEVQLIAYRDPMQPKYVLVVFRLVARHGEINSTHIDHAMVELVLYAQASQFNNEPFVNFVVSPDAHEPIVFLSHSARCGFETLTTTTISMNDLLEQFPRQVENLLTQMSFITTVMRESKSLSQLDRSNQ